MHNELHHVNQLCVLPPGLSTLVDWLTLIRMLSAAEAHAFIYVWLPQGHTITVTTLPSRLKFKTQELFNGCVVHLSESSVIQQHEGRPKTWDRNLITQMHVIQTSPQLPHNLMESLAAGCSLRGGWLSLHKSFLFHKQFCISFINSEIEVCYT